MVELDLGKYGTDREVDVATEGHARDKNQNKLKREAPDETSTSTYYGVG
jgi:hypothetical protein